MFRWLCVSFLLLFLSSGFTHASDGVETSPTAIWVFLLFVFSSMGITYWAAQHTKNRDQFYTGGGKITPLQNGLAIAGDFISAATLLGITGLMFNIGYDAYILSYAIIVGWTFMLIFIAERFRNSGNYTFFNVVTSRFDGKAIKILISICSLIVVMFYLIGQMVGAGKLIELLFGIDYLLAVTIVSALVIIYVSIGGMLATTWVQMVKAVLLIIAGAALALGLTFKFGLFTIFEKAAQLHNNGEAILSAGGWLQNDPLNVVTVGLTMCFGMAGLPHILMRFFTVKDAADARKSVAYATVLMSIFYLFILIIGFGAIVLLWGQNEFYNDAGQLIGGANMVAIHAAWAIGGDFLYGFLAAVAFATILAVVAGLTISAAATIAHDLYSVTFKDNQGDHDTELKISRWSVVVIGIIGVGLGSLFETQNIAIVVAFAMAIAASVNFPILIFSMYWGRLTSHGATRGGVLALVFTMVLIVLSDSIWVGVLGNEKAIFPYAYPTIFSMPFGFFAVFLFSYLDNTDKGQQEIERFKIASIKAEIGDV